MTIGTFNSESLLGFFFFAKGCCFLLTNFLTSFWQSVLSLFFKSFSSSNLFCDLTSEKFYSADGLVKVLSFFNCLKSVLKISVNSSTNLTWPFSKRKKVFLLSLGHIDTSFCLNCIESVYITANFASVCSCINQSPPYFLISAQNLSFILLCASSILSNHFSLFLSLFPSSVA